MFCIWGCVAHWGAVSHSGEREGFALRVVCALGKGACGCKKRLCECKFGSSVALARVCANRTAYKLGSRTMANVFAWARKQSGKRQRQMADEIDLAGPASSSTDAPSHLVTELLEFWACKSLSAVSVQKIAAAVVADGCMLPEVIKLASIGSQGRHKNHCNKDLENRFAMRIDNAALHCRDDFAAG